MGSGGKKGHEAFPIAPADDNIVAEAPQLALEPVTAQDQAIFTHYTSDDTVEGISGAGTFAEMSQAVAGAQAQLAAAAQQPAELQMPQLWAESNKAIHEASTGWLNSKTDEELHQLAAAAGFQHPEMVSGKALKGWLDPSYPADAEYKAKIAAKAIERYNAAVAAGKIVPPVKNELPEGHWVATPAEVLEAQSAFLAAAEQLPTNSPWYQDTTVGKLNELIAAENKLATAHCPELAETLEASKAQAKELVDARIAGSSGAGAKLVGQSIADGTLPEHANLLSTSDALQLIRASTSKADKSDAHVLMDLRSGAMDEIAAAKQKLTELNGGAFHSYVKPKPFTSAQDLLDYNNAAKAYREGCDAFKTWHCNASPPPYVGADTFAQGLRHGAKSLDMDQLRAAATMHGLKDAKGASRAQLQNWMLGQWHPEIDPAQVESVLAAKKAKPKATPAPAPVTPLPNPTPTPATSAPSSNSGTVGPPPAPGSAATVTDISPTAGSGKWFRKHQQLVAALKHQAASLADAPARPPAAEVDSWAFSNGPAMHLGGAHTKEVVTAPDGSLWMFKPTKDPYRALSESGANGILHRAGIPTVPVYAKKFNNQNGTVQPLIKGASTFPSEPSQWSQSDVDAIVRYHAAAWMVGDHDAKYDNLLRTPSGGVVPIDHGQAFKFWGQDQLTPDFHPNASYGSKPPVWNVLYQAAKAGKLAPGVKVRPAAALPVITQIESISDSEFTSMIKPSAKAGAASGSTSHWRPVFEKRAAAKHGKTPSAQQVADEFIAFGVERKNAVRKSFIKFFADLGVDNADVLSKVKAA